MSQSKQEMMSDEKIEETFDYEGAGRLLSVMEGFIIGYVWEGHPMIANAHRISWASDWMTEVAFADRLIPINPEEAQKIIEKCAARMDFQKMEVDLVATIAFIEGIVAAETRTGSKDTLGIATMVRGLSGVSAVLRVWGRRGGRRAAPNNANEEEGTP